MSSATLERKNRRVGLMALAIAAGMLGLGYASVPLYRLFCQVTGFGGTTQVASEAEAAAMRATGEEISIRFDSNVAAGLPWEFKPEQRTMKVRIGEQYLAFYTASNNSSRPVVGQASYSVEPEYTGIHFTKIDCFCFTRQVLQPYEQVRMPVQFVVDPAILDDENANGVEQITLSYTFYEIEEPST